MLKFGFLANARVLARSEGSHYVILVSFLDHPSADNFRENLKRQQIEEIEAKAHVTEADELEEQRIKKLKLRVKDQMNDILAQYRHSTVS